MAVTVGMWMRVRVGIHLETTAEIQHGRLEVMLQSLERVRHERLKLILTVDVGHRKRLTWCTTGATFRVVVRAIGAFLLGEGIIVALLAATAVPHPLGYVVRSPVVRIGGHCEVRV